MTATIDPFVVGIGAGLVLGPAVHRVARIEANYVRSRANAIRKADETERLLDAARERINRR